MILMPYYGVPLSKDFVQKNQMLEKSSTVTIRNGDKEVHYFAVPAICGTDTLVTFKDLESIKEQLDKSLEVLMTQQKQEVAQALCVSEREFFVTFMDY